MADPEGPKPTAPTAEEEASAAAPAAAAAPKAAAERRQVRLAVAEEGGGGPSAEEVDAALPPPGALAALSGLPKSAAAAVHVSSAAASTSTSPPSAKADLRKSFAARQSLAGYRGMNTLSSPSYFLEKPAIVIDFGTAYTKVGFAAEGWPRHIFPSPELSVRSVAGEEHSSTPSEKQWLEILDPLLNRIFFHYLSVSPKDRRVVICDAVFASAPFRSALALLLFRRLAVLSTNFVTDLVLPLYLTGLNTGLVVDCGSSGSRVLATFAGVPVLSAFRAAACGQRRLAAAFRERMRRSLGAGAPPLDWLDDLRVVDDVIAQACYVACDFPAVGDRPRMLLKTDRSMTVPLASGGEVVVPTDCRWQPAEVLFKGADARAGQESAEELPTGGSFDDCANIPEAFLSVLQRCSVDVRAVVVQNVVVCGGCAQMCGFLPRLAVEVQAALRQNPSTAALAERLLFTPLDFPPVGAVWAGGAVLGALDNSRDYSAVDYAKEDTPLRDWAKDGYV